jgi:hypothetical protein
MEAICPTKTASTQYQTIGTYLRTTVTQSIKLTSLDFETCKYRKSIAVNNVSGTRVTPLRIPDTLSCHPLP